MPVDLSAWKILAMLAFLLIFLGVVIWTFVVGRSQRFQHDAGLPLDEGRPVPTSSDSSFQEQNHA